MSLSECISVATHCSPANETSLRYAGRWIYQLAVDTIAYAQNIPIRILRIDGLKNLPNVIKGLAESASGQHLLRNAGVADIFDRTTLYNEAILDKAVDWLVSLAGSDAAVCDHQVDPPPEGWYSAMLQLLPHIERSVWLTEMGNPHPAHALTRMLDHWSLYVLCWCYKNRVQFEEPNAQNVPKALGVEGYVLILEQEFTLARKHKTADRTDHRCRLVIGPVWSSDAKPKVFEDRFYRFVQQAQEIAEWRHDLAIKTPSRQEVRDALTSRVGMPHTEASLRAQSSQSAFVNFLLHVQLPIEKLGELARDDWEQLAMLCSWLARWQFNLRTKMSLNQIFWVSAIEGCGLGICLVREQALHSWRIEYCSRQPVDSITAEEWNNMMDVRGTPQWRVDLPSVYWNRMQERQNAAWTAQIVAINNLLQGHTEDSVGLASNYEIAAHEQKPEYEAANHLLRGYGGRICHHLLSLTRADIADLYWCDYGQDPLRLVHVGGYMRLIEHRANRQAIHEHFDRTVWDARPVKGFDARLRPIADLGEDSPSQAYRVAATGQEDLPTGQEGVSALFESFDNLHDESAPRPCSAMAFPLLVNQRVVGVLTFAGLSSRQFSRRLSASLHRASNLIGQAMYGASLLWQMRQITSFFTRTPFERLRQYDQGNAFNPLRTVSRCLANVFLCRGVHIWLKDPLEPTRFQLYGNNMVISNTEAPTQLKLKRLDTSAASLEQAITYSAPFLAFAQRLCALGYMANGIRAPRYALPQGRFVSKSPRENADGYSLKNALKGLLLYEEFVSDVGGSGSFVDQKRLRQRIFKEYGFNDLATFALVQEFPGGESSWVGGVTLHDLPTTLIEDDEHPKPWPDPWQSVTAHVQTFLPNLLSQVEVLNRPLDDMRRFLLHEGRFELESIKERVHNLVKGDLGVLSPDGALRRSLRNYLDHAVKPEDQVRIFDKQLDSLRGAIADLNSDRIQYRLDALVLAIDKHRDLSELGGDLMSVERFVNIEESVRYLIGPDEDNLRHRGIIPDIKGFRRPVELWVHYLWWERIISNLVKNAAKYARESFEVRWMPESRTIRFSNVAVFDPDQDSRDRLFIRGARGSAARLDSKEPIRGQGYGLWGARLMCELAGLALDLHTVPQARTVFLEDGRQLGLARYNFDLHLPGGGRMR